MRSRPARPIVAIVAVNLLAAVLTGSGEAAPEGTLTWGLHVTLAARWLDPSDTEAFINPFMVLYALHDALVKPMPAGDNTPSLAESWTVSKDGLPSGLPLAKTPKFTTGNPLPPAELSTWSSGTKARPPTLSKER